MTFIESLWGEGVYFLFLSRGSKTNSNEGKGTWVFWADMIVSRGARKYLTNYGVQADASRSWENNDFTKDCP